MVPVGEEFMSHYIGKLLRGYLSDRTNDLYKERWIELIHLLFLFLCRNESFSKIIYYIGFPGD